jgi:GNAT superfamily N-acetyltransferase
MSDPLVIRPYRAEDAADVRSVLTASYGAAATPAPIFNWWHFGCPVAASGFRVAELNGKIVGIQPMQLFSYEQAGHRLSGAMLTGVVVHPEFRRRGLFARLIKACEQDAWRRGADFVTTMPNERSRPGFMKLGYREPGRRRLLLLPLNVSEMARRAVRWRPLAALLGFGLKPAICRSRKWLRTPAVDLERVKLAPEDLDRVSKADRQLFPGLRLMRSRAWWEWRYAASPRGYHMLRLRDEQGATAGLVTTSRERRNGVEVGYIVDWLARDPDRVPILLAGAVRHLSAAGAAIVAGIVSSGFQIRALASVGFGSVPHWAPLKRFFTVFKPAPTMSTALAEQLGTIGAWHQTLGDWDNL